MYMGVSKLCVKHDMTHTDHTRHQSTPKSIGTVRQTTINKADVNLSWNDKSLADDLYNTVHGCIQ